jgi:ABC-2 type transport system permease protein
MKQKIKSFCIAVKSIWLSEYKRLFSDKGVLLFFVGVQLMYPIIYPIPLHNQHVRELPVAVVDQDNSMMSRQLLRMIDATENMRIAERAQTLDETIQDFYKGTINGMIVIPKDFEKSIIKGERTAVAVYSDARYFMIYRQVYSGVVQAAGVLSAGIEVKKLMAKGIPAAQALNLRDPVPVESVPMYNANGGYGSYLIPAVLIIILQQTLLIGIGMLGGTSRERKALHYLIPDAHKTKSILPVIAGKTLCYLSFYIIHVVYFFGVLFKVYSYPQLASIITIVIYLIPFLLAVIFLALTLSTFFRSRESSVMFLLCTSIPFVLFSGFSWPIDSMPLYLKVIAYCIPTTKGIEGFMRLNMMGAPFSAVFKSWMFLWGLAAVYFVCAALSFRRMLHIRKKETIFE